MLKHIQLKEGDLIHVRDDIYKQPYRYRGRKHNRYFLKRACVICGETTFQGSSNGRRHKRPVCSSKCHRAIRTGNNSNLWSGGYVATRGPKVKNSHMLRRATDHPAAVNGYVPDHRIV